jgi:GNAT superfamily N-acetyltransferase
LSAAPPVYLSALDEERFGVRTAKTSQVTLDNLSQIYAYCETNKVALLIARCPVADLNVVQAMEHDGFALMDTLVYYGHHLVNIPSLTERCSVRPVRPGDETAVQQVASEAFRGYFGHYHADSRLDRTQCDEVYISWAYRACVSREVAHEVLVADCDGTIQGFITLRANSAEEGEGGLFGVSPTARGTGIASLLMVRALEWCRAQKMRRMLISTQITNLASQKVWTRLGFEPSHAYYTLHKWFD